MNSEDLIRFEEDIAAEFNAGKIRAPIHLSHGNEQQLIEIFSTKVYPQDWVMGSWRMHYQCLLKGVPPKELKAEIMAGRSIALCFPKYRIVSSGIVGGILPIALGVAKSIQLLGDSDAWVHCFMGDMTAECGITYEVVKYALNFDLPITFYLEDNGLGVCTPTLEAWGARRLSLETKPNVHLYRYEQDKYPHAGAGKRVQF
jgi:TPP-dependent pyruvate/acetoin dehydrogenase alpha subunit